MMTRRGFLKRLVGLGVGVLGVHQALSTITTASNVVFDRSGGIEKRKGFTGFDRGTRDESVVVMTREQAEWFWSQCKLPEGSPIMGCRVLISEPMT